MFTSSYVSSSTVHWLLVGELKREPQSQRPGGKLATPLVGIPCPAGMWLLVAVSFLRERRTPSTEKWVKCCTKNFLLITLVLHGSQQSPTVCMEDTNITRKGFVLTFKVKAVAYSQNQHDSKGATFILK